MDIRTGWKSRNKHLTTTWLTLTEYENNAKYRCIVWRFEQDKIKHRYGSNECLHPRKNFKLWFCDINLYWKRRIICQILISMLKNDRKVKFLILRDLYFEHALNFWWWLHNFIVNCTWFSLLFNIQSHYMCFIIRLIVQLEFKFYYWSSFLICLFHSMIKSNHFIVFPLSIKTSHSNWSQWAQTDKGIGKQPYFGLGRKW